MLREKSLLQNMGKNHYYIKCSNENNYKLKDYTCV